MLVGFSLLILIVIALFALILGSNFTASISTIEVNSDSIINGSSSTFVIPETNVLFSIDTTNLINAGIAILVAIIIIVVIFGLTVLASGFNPEASKIAILVTTYIAVWSTLSILAFNLIVSIEVFGTVIYVSLTIAYTIGVIKKMSGGND